jgi:hypothetical protein
MQVRRTVVTFLEQLNIRCSECGAWFAGQTIIERELDAEEIIGGISFFNNSSYHKTEVRGCGACGCTHSRKYLGTEPA